MAQEWEPTRDSEVDKDWDHCVRAGVKCKCTVKVKVKLIRRVNDVSDIRKVDSFT